MNLDEGLRRFGIVVAVIIGAAGGGVLGYGFAWDFGWSGNPNVPEIFKGVILGFLCGVGISLGVLIVFWAIRWIMRGFQDSD